MQQMTASVTLPQKFDPLLIGWQRLIVRPSLNGIESKLTPVWCRTIRTPSFIGVYWTAPSFRHVERHRSPNRTLYLHSCDPLRGRSDPWDTHLFSKPYFKAEWKSISTTYRRDLRHRPTMGVIESFGVHNRYPPGRDLHCSICLVMYIHSRLARFWE